MTDPTALLEALIAAGTPANLIAQVAQLSAEVSSIRKRRAADATRQSESRKRRHVTSVTSHDVTPQHILPPKEVQKPKTASVHARKSVLSADWVLPEEGRVYARGKGWDDTKIDLEAERFKNHAHGGERKQSNWLSAWRNWVTSPFQQNGSGGARVARKGTGYLDLALELGDTHERTE